MTELPKTVVAMPAPSYEYEFHELANEYPMIEGDEFNALADNITKHGILEPIIRYQGKVLDGRNRYNAAKAVGHKFTERDFKDLAPSLDPEEFVSAKNDHRRNLDNRQKRALIGRKIIRHPTFSDRAIAKLACCDHKTVASVREDMRKRVETFTRDWNELNILQRREFVVAVREEISGLLGISPAQSS